MAPPISMRKCWQKWTRLKMLPFVSRKNCTFWLKSNNNQKNVAGRQPNCWDSLQLEGRKRVNVSNKYNSRFCPCLSSSPGRSKVCFAYSNVRLNVCVYTRVCMCAAHLLASGSSISFISFSIGWAVGSTFPWSLGALNPALCLIIAAFPSWHNNINLLLFK
jgi:hypothetical protein